jgi:hypothetical protein
MTRYGRPGPHRDVLLRWTGRDASGDTWERPLDSENLTNCEEAIAARAFERATGPVWPHPTSARTAPATGTRYSPPPRTHTSTPHLRRTSARRSWADRCSIQSTDGRTTRTAGSAAPGPLPASARVPRSRTRRPASTPGRPRHCAARRTRCSTPPPAAPAARWVLPSPAAAAVLQRFSRISLRVTGTQAAGAAGRGGSRAQCSECAGSGDAQRCQDSDSDSA